MSQTPALSSQGKLFAVGNRFADEAAGEAARHAWALCLVSEPSADKWDAVAALVVELAEPSRKRLRLPLRRTFQAKPLPSSGPGVPPN